MARRRFRPNSCKLYAAGDSPRIIQFLTSDRAAAMVRENRAAELKNEDGVVVGIQLCEKSTEARARNCALVPNIRDARTSPVVLTAAEAAAVAERHKSRTEGLPFDSHIREQRVRAGLPECDRAEYARIKFHAMFPALQHA